MAGQTTYVLCMQSKLLASCTLAKIFISLERSSKSVTEIATSLHAADPMHLSLPICSPGDHVIFPTEAEAYVKELAPFSIADIGSSRYIVSIAASYSCTAGQSREPGHALLLRAWSGS